MERCIEGHRGLIPAMPWRCRTCAKNLTNRRPPNNECQSCRPYSKIGWHNKSRPTRRLMKKTPPCSIQRQPKAAKLGDCEQSHETLARVEKLKNGLESEMAVLLQITRRDFATVHSVLASAHALLQCFERERNSIKLPCTLELAIASLISVAMATSARVCDADAVRVDYRIAHRIKRSEMMAMECFWTNHVGNSFSAHGLLGS